MNEKNIKEIRERHTEEIKEFQDKCNHTDILDWIWEMWAPGHFNGMVKVCNVCGITMERKSGHPNLRSK